MELYNDDLFYWNIPPGKYFFVGYRWIRNGAFTNTDLRGPVRDDVEIPSSVSSCYAGALRMRFTHYDKGPDEVSVNDDLENVKKTLAQQFPSLRSNSETCFLTMEAPK